MQNSTGFVAQSIEEGAIRREKLDHAQRAVGDDDPSIGVYRDSFGPMELSRLDAVRTDDARYRVEVAHSLHATIERIGDVKYSAAVYGGHKGELELAASFSWVSIWR
jgi:hypothetical protein